ncbi:hypothetical protein [Thermus thermamylovorans]|uniref:Uncharacterized protein n=1 Tax=Thermus thermamylovorans TaxID=2509362 RepID=A0A4Q9B6C7_9DEIN|nr:hypothetical protein [Thermus thermamylovorans]TBH20040.1 hypothetical protein ETP66_07805 [Thermus thermamylovorans]
MRPFLLGLALGGLLGAGAVWMAAFPAARDPLGPQEAYGVLPVQSFPFPQGEEGSCEPQVYLFWNGEFFRLLPIPGGEPQELLPVQPAPNPFGGS